MSMQPRSHNQAVGRSEPGVGCRRLLFAGLTPIALVNSPAPPATANTIETVRAVRQTHPPARLVILPADPALALEIEATMASAVGRLDGLAAPLAARSIRWVTHTSTLPPPGGTEALATTERIALTDTEGLRAAAQEGQLLCYLSAGCTSDLPMIEAMRRFPGVLLIDLSRPPDHRVLSRMTEAAVVVATTLAEVCAAAPIVALRREILGELADRFRTTPPTTALALTWSEMLAQLRRPLRTRILYDVTQISRHDARTGIQRVTRELATHLIPQLAARYDFVPVTVSDPGGTLALVRNDGFLAGLPGHPQLAATSPEVISPGDGDVLLNVDVNLDGTIQLGRSGVLAEWRARGLRTIFLVHDLLPIERPADFPDMHAERFRDWFATIRTQGDVLLSTTHTGQEAIARQIGTQPPDAGIRTGVITLGARAGPKRQNDPADVAQHGHLLVVGTIEPRKGHAALIAAMDILWQAGSEQRLVMVGQAGWNCESLCDSIRAHPELGRRLFWWEGCDDQQLTALYAGARGLIAPSEAEGFGLPVIEAAQHGVPLLLRDIPVFREIAGEAAAYFADGTTVTLARAIADWLAAIAAGRAPDPAPLRWRTWDASAAAVLQALFEPTGDRPA